MDSTRNDRRSPAVPGWAPQPTITWYTSGKSSRPLLSGDQAPFHMRAKATVTVPSAARVARSSHTPPLVSRSWTYISAGSADCPDTRPTRSRSPPKVANSAR